MCCISLACSVHRDTARKVDYCSDKLQRETCAKNTIRLLKSDPNLTCPQCTIRTIQYKAPIPSENISCDNGGHFIAAARDDSDGERSWTHDDVIQSFSAAQLQAPSLVSSCSRPTSTHFDLQLSGHLQFDMYDLAELSHEDGLQLIDEMYGAEHPDCDAEDMDTSHDEMYYVPAETHQDLKEAHIREILLSNQEGAMTDNYLYLLKPNGHTSTDFNETKEVDIEANMSEARKLLQRARQELDKLKHTRQEMEPQYLWCLEKYTIMAQISVESRL